MSTYVCAAVYGSPMFNGHDRYAFSTPLSMPLAVDATVEYFDHFPRLKLQLSIVSEQALTQFSMGSKWDNSIWKPPVRKETPPKKESLMHSVLKMISYIFSKCH